MIKEAKCYSYLDLQHRIVGIRPQINHMKLDKHTQKLLLSPSVRIARSKLFLIFPTLRVLQLASPDVYIYTHGQITDQPTIT
jgi:hypothetical protein